MSLKSQIFTCVAPTLIGAGLFVSAAKADIVYVSSEQGTPNGYVAAIGGGTLSGLNNPANLAIFQSSLYIAVYGSDVITKTPLNLSSSSTYATLPGMSGPFSLAFDPAGDLFVAATQSSKIVEFGPGGGGAPTTVTTAITNPYGLAFDTAGNLFVASVAGAPNGTIYEITNPGALGQLVTPLALANVNDPRDLAFDSGGNLYVSNNNASPSPINGYVEEYSGTTDLGPFASGLNGPNQIAFGSNGNLYIADYFAGDVEEWKNNVFVSTDATGIPNANGLAILPSSPIPEPSTFGLIGLGLSAVALLRRKIA